MSCVAPQTDCAKLPVAIPRACLPDGPLSASILFDLRRAFNCVLHPQQSRSPLLVFETCGFCVCV